MNRAGSLVRQPDNYDAFIPKPLPPDPPLKLDEETSLLLSEASLSLGKLTGLTSIVSEPDLFIYIFVRKEALLSSQIEGTQCSLEDVLSPELDSPERKDDIEEVTNYVLAMNKGLAGLKDLPVCTRLIKQIHGVLMEGVRGQNKTPGEFRKSQNWIGPLGCTLTNATFVPPPPHLVEECIGKLENYIHEEDMTPPLIKAALIHAQFETIHPFLDGNGRLGRLLITFLLCYWTVLDQPLLYISYYFKRHKSEYYAKLMDTRMKGDWESWIKFFLRAVKESADISNSTALSIFKLHQIDKEKVFSNSPTRFTVEVFNEFCKNPIQTSSYLLKNLSTSTKPKIQRSLNHLEELNIVKEVTGKQRNKKYVYDSYLKLLL